MSRRGAEASLDLRQFFASDASLTRVIRLTSCMSDYNTPIASTTLEHLLVASTECICICCVNKHSIAIWQELCTHSRRVADSVIPRTRLKHVALGIRTHHHTKTRALQLHGWLHECPPVQRKKTSGNTARCKKALRLTLELWRFK